MINQSVIKESFQRLSLIIYPFLISINDLKLTLSFINSISLPSAFSHVVPVLCCLRAHAVLFVFSKRREDRGNHRENTVCLGTDGPSPTEIFSFRAPFRFFALLCPFFVFTLCYEFKSKEL